MSNLSTLSMAPLDSLVLDVNNPRFAELYSGSDNEEDLIEYLLYTEAAYDISKAINNAKEFYPDEPLWVLRKKDKYLVKDGNRRCAAVKALQSPSKYQLGIQRLKIENLPILIFEDENYLNQRIREKHAFSLFREWDRIAKALEVFALHDSGSSIDSMKEIDSQPAQLIKLASFYYAAVKIGGEDLKKLLRRGRGKSGGKTIIFERLFSYGKSCGYQFKNKPSYQVSITNNARFQSYVSSMIGLLEDNPQITHSVVDQEKTDFLERLEPYGFEKSAPSRNAHGASESNQSGPTKDDHQSSEGPKKTSSNESTKRMSIKNKPRFERKGIPSALHGLIQECYDLNQDTFANAKTALTRVSFECTLKYVVENTKYDSKNELSKSAFFSSAFYDKGGKRLKFTNFENLKNKFSELIINNGVRNAFRSFDLNTPHQIIHNYNVVAVPSEARALCDNLVPILEFLLKEEGDLLNGLDLSKL